MANNYRNSLGTLKLNLQVLVAGLEQALASVELEQGILTQLEEIHTLETLTKAMTHDIQTERHRLMVQARKDQLA